MENEKISIIDKGYSDFRTVMMLAWPATMEQVLVTLAGYVDAAMVGSLGVNAAASVTMNTTLSWMIFGVFMSFGAGFSILVAKAIGENDISAAKKTISQSIIGMAVLSVFVFVFIELIAPVYGSIMGAEKVVADGARDYLQIIGFAMVFQTILSISGAVIRGTGDTRTPMILNTSFNLLNVVFNYLFIYPKGRFLVGGVWIRTFGLGLGIRGAALGTAVSAAIAGVLMFLCMLSRRRAVHVTIKEAFIYDREVMKEVTVLSLPLVFERVSISFGQVIGTGLATSLGTMALAAHQLANSAEQICYMPPAGFAIAVTTLVAQARGAERPDKKKAYAGICMKCGVCVMILMAVIMFIFAPQLMGFFIRDEEVIRTGALLLRIEAFVEPCLAICNVGTGIMKGEGNTKIPFRIGLVGMWIIRVPLSFLFVSVLGMGVASLWVAMSLDWIIRAVMCIVSLKKSDSI